MKRKPTPLHLNVKASGYTIRMGLLYTSPGGDDVELPVQPQTSTVINFGKVKICSMLLEIYMYPPVKPSIRHSL